MRTVVLLAPAVLFSGCAADRAERVAADPTPAATDSAPTVVRITCTEDGKTILETPEVAAQRDGVHLRVDNRSGEPASIDPFGRDAEPGIQEFVTSTAPGKVDVVCYPFSQHDSGEKGPSKALTVTDPGGYWTDRELGCPRGGTSVAIYDGVGDGSREDPVKMARAMMKQLRDEDVVELAAYPEAQIPTVRVVRDGRIIALAGFEAVDEEGNYVLSSISQCSDANVGGV